MGKIIAWLILIFLVLLALRLIGVRNARARRQAAQGTAAKSAAEPMVRCVRCGVFLPRAEAKQSGGSYVCATGVCATGSPHG
jgi:Flp pilus assembly protein TadB